MPGKPGHSEQGMILAVVLMVLAALSMLAVAGKGDAALQWLQIRNSREYGDAVQLVETGIARALATDRFDLDRPQSGRYCRIASRCVDWTVRHVETTTLPHGVEAERSPARALHFEISAQGQAGPRAKASAVMGFLLVAPGSVDAPLPDSIEICGGEDDCPEDTAPPPIRRYWREVM